MVDLCINKSTIIVLHAAAALAVAISPAIGKRSNCLKIY